MNRWKRIQRRKFAARVIWTKLKMKRRSIFRRRIKKLQRRQLLSKVQASVASAAFLYSNQRLKVPLTQRKEILKQTWSKLSRKKVQASGANNEVKFVKTLKYSSFVFISNINLRLCHIDVESTCRLGGFTIFKKNSIKLTLIGLACKLYVYAT